MSQSGYNAYVSYLSLKLHFTQKDFNYFRSRSKASVKSFEKRRDKYFFNKLAKNEKYEEILLSNFVERKTAWIGEILEEDSTQIYKKWLRKMESISYVFEQDVNKLDDTFAKNFAIVDQHPLILKMYLQDEITFETLVILSTFIDDTIPKWDSQIKENYVWPEIKMKIIKYKPFLQEKIDKKKIIAILKRRYV